MWMNRRPSVVGAALPWTSRRCEVKVVRRVVDGHYMREGYMGEVQFTAEPINVLLFEDAADAETHALMAGLEDGEFTIE